MPGRGGVRQGSTRTIGCSPSSRPWRASDSQRHLSDTGAHQDATFKEQWGVGFRVQMPQGDILLIRIDDAETAVPIAIAPADAPVILAEGELTGHRHAFYDGAVLFRDEQHAALNRINRALY